MEELDNLLADLEQAIKPLPSPNKYTSPSNTTSTGYRSSKMTLSTERPMSPHGITSSTLGSRTTTTSVRKYTESSSRKVFGEELPRGRTPPPPKTEEFHYTSGSTNLEPKNQYGANTTELDTLLDDLNNSAIIGREVYKARSDYGSQSSMVDHRGSNGQVSKLVSDMERELRGNEKSIDQWSRNERNQSQEVLRSKSPRAKSPAIAPGSTEVKPLATTYYRETHHTYEVKPEPLPTNILRSAHSSPRLNHRTPSDRNLEQEITTSLDNLKIIETKPHPDSNLRPSSLRSSRANISPRPQIPDFTSRGDCCVCQKPIVGQIVHALGKNWHLEHFTCVHCGIELGKENFFERNGKPYCENDYHMLFSPKCALCSQPIIDKCVSALDKTWHPEHFVCCICHHPFNDEGYHEMDGKAYCRHDYFDLFAPKCAGCSHPITDNYISALDAQWHPDCFVCWECRCPFVGGSFFDFEGKPYCETHYHAKRGSLCAGCHKPIMGRCITAMFRKFHPEHFVCSFCLKQLNKGTFKEQNDKPYCHGCFDKLFS